MSSRATDLAVRIVVVLYPVMISGRKTSRKQDTGDTPVILFTLQTCRTARESNAFQDFEMLNQFEEPSQTGVTREILEPGVYYS